MAESDFTPSTLGVSSAGSDARKTTQAIGRGFLEREVCFDVATVRLQCSLTGRVAEMLRNRQQSDFGGLVFANRDSTRYLVTSINHLHQKASAAIGLGRIL